VFLDASQREGFVDTAYLPEQDCLLVALHYRALPGHVLWHSWTGDLLRLSDATKDAEEPLCPVPSFNDWWHFVADKGGRGSNVPASPGRFLDHDARNIGYCRAVEKLLVPTDGSIILQTTLQRGLSENLPRPLEAGSTSTEQDTAARNVDPEASDDRSETSFAAPPQFETRTVRVLKDSLAFGMVTDAEWLGKAGMLRKRREQQEEEDLQATAAVAAGSEPTEANPTEEAEQLETNDDAEDRAATPEGSIRPVTEQRLEDLRFGSLWVAFRDGARCTARMHHEREWFAHGDLAFDVALARPGVLMTYRPASGMAVQAFSDGSVRQVWPTQHHSLRGTEMGDSLPGGIQDFEVTRTVTPFGVLLRTLLSGRREVYHPDGTQAVRNPTVAEMRERCQKEGGGPVLQLLERLAAAYEEVQGRQPSEKQPTMLEKATGLPGHWRIARPDGRLFGRVAVPPQPAPVQEECASPLASDGAAEVAVEEPVRPPDSSADGGGEDTSRALLELLDGVLVEDGATVEYEIDPISVTTVTDPHTGQRASTNTDGVLIVEETRAGSSVCLLPDGSQMTRSPHQEGHRIVIEKKGTARVMCTLNTRTLSPSALVDVICDDGGRMEVVPQRLDHKGQLVPSDPSRGTSAEFSTNASVLLRRSDGTAILSRGAGHVDIVSGQGDTLPLEAEALWAAADQAGVYVAHLDEDSLRMRDPSGNAFEVHGDHTVSFKLAVSMGDDFPSPRCVVAGRPYGHPDAKYLPLPEEAPSPRLFVVAGNGEAEELLPVRSGAAPEELLRRTAGANSRAVLRSEPLGPPLEGCRCHSLLCPAPEGAAPMEPAALPPSIAGLHAGADRRGMAGRGLQHGGFTALRQLVEYPPVSEEKRQALQEAQARFQAREGERRAARPVPGQWKRRKPPPRCPPPSGLAREPADGGA